MEEEAERDSRGGSVASEEREQVGGGGGGGHGRVAAGDGSGPEGFKPGRGGCPVGRTVQSTAGPM